MNLHRVGETLYEHPRKLALRRRGDLSEIRNATKVFTDTKAKLQKTIQIIES